MKGLIKAAVLSAALTMLAGCDSAGSFKSETPVTYVIKPGTWFVINENPEPTWGTEGCYRSQRELIGKLLTDVSDGPHNGCIVVRPETTTVQIKVSILGKPMELETWAVERDGTETKFRRPDGGYAMYYPKGPAQVYRLVPR